METKIHKVGYANELAWFSNDKDTVFNMVSYIMETNGLMGGFHSDQKRKEVAERYDLKEVKSVKKGRVYCHCEELDIIAIKE